MSVSGCISSSELRAAQAYRSIPSTSDCIPLGAGGIMTDLYLHRRLSVMAGALAACLAASNVCAQQLYFPIVVPITGILAVEGANQRNGSQLAMKQAPARVTIPRDVVDPGSSASSAVTALERAIAAGQPIAAVASVFGTEMLA